MACMLGWNEFVNYAKGSLQFSQHEIVQWIGTTVLIFGLFFVYHGQLYGSRTSVVRIPRKICISVWLAFMIIVTIQARPVGERIVSWNIGSTISAMIEGNTYVQYQALCNVLLFIPFGVLIPMNIWYCRRWWIQLLICIMCTVLIELQQLLTARGTFDINDILTDIIGGMIGYVIFSVSHKVFLRIKK